MPEPQNIAIEIPVAGEIRHVAERLRMPYDHVRGIVAAHATPLLLDMVQGKVGEIVLEHVEATLVTAGAVTPAYVPPMPGTSPLPTEPEA